MKKLSVLACAFALIVFVAYFSPRTHSQISTELSVKIQTTPSEEERRQASFYLANILARQMVQYRPLYDFELVSNTLREIETRKNPLLSKRECQQQMLALLDKLSQHQANQDLQAAEEYLSVLSKRGNITEVIPKKVYYEILQSGLATRAPQEEAFRIHLIEIQFNEGKEDVVRDTHISDTPLTLLLSDTFPGFAKAVADMTYGERRKIYLHPEFTYGSYGRQHFQQLLIYDVERLPPIQD